MAKVTIVIEDTDDGGVNVQMLWDPPVDPDEDDVTTAQKAAIICMDAMQAEASEFEEISSEDTED